MDTYIKLVEKKDILKKYINNAKNTLRLLITKKCNSNCVYCYEEGIIGSTNKQPQLLDLGDFKNIIKAAKEIGVKRISISGGEPTLYFDWVKELVELCHKQNLLVYLTTNATNRKIINLAKKYPKLEFRISLDCYSREQYKYFRGIDNFDKVIGTLQELSKLKNEIHINRVVISIKNEWKNFNSMIDMIVKKGLNKKKNLFLRLIPCYPNKASQKLEVLNYIKYLSKYIQELKTQLHQMLSYKQKKMC
jgi:cyclic pyranopterin phosphate synthase